MKKFYLVSLVAILLVALTLPALALENTFSGYWRTRFITQQNFNGIDSEGIAGVQAGDWAAVDTRTRLGYDAKINDDLKFVAQLEIDAVWGYNPASDATITPWTPGGYNANAAPGTRGTDALELRLLYTDFNLGKLNTKIGLQQVDLMRGFITQGYAYAALKLDYQINKNISIPFYWMKYYEGGQNFNEGDVDTYVINPKIGLNEHFTITPIYMFETSKDAKDMKMWKFTKPTASNNVGPFNNLNFSTMGIDLDVDYDVFNMFFTSMFQIGSAEWSDAAWKAEYGATEDKLEMRGWMLALGADANFGSVSPHGQFLYFSGNSTTNVANNRWDGWARTQYQYYGWAEILGGGTFDQTIANGSPGYLPTDLIAFGLGTTVNPIEKLSLRFDVWYAQKAEDELLASGEKINRLGVEFDLKVTYEIVQNMNMDIVGAYLFAGNVVHASDDANGNKILPTGDHQRNPYELGCRLSYSF